MTTKHTIQELKERMAHVAPPTPKLEPVEDTTYPARGQVWTTSSRNVIVWDTQDWPFAIVVPLFHETELASHQDVLLPREVFGHRVAFSPSMLFTMVQADLQECLGTLPDPWMSWMKETMPLALYGDPIPDHIPHGLPYLDEQDVRWTFHMDLCDELAPLMDAAWKRLEKLEDMPNED